MTSFYVVVALLTLIFVTCQFSVLRATRRYVFGRYGRIEYRKGLTIFVALLVVNIFLAFMSMNSGWSSSDSQAQKFLAVTFFTYLGITASIGIFLGILKTFYLTSNLAVAGYRLLLIMISGDMVEAPSVKGLGADCSKCEAHTLTGASTMGSDLHFKTRLPVRRSESVKPVIFGLTGVQIQSTGSRRIARIVALGVILLFTGVGIYGVVEAYSRPLIERFQLRDESLSGLSRPVSIIQVTDLHYGQFYDKTNLESIVNRLNSIDGDALVMTGDIFHTPQTKVESATEVLKNLRQRKFGNFVVMGNHDFYTGEGRSVLALESAGLTVLRDEWRTFTEGRAIIHLAGLDDPKKNWLLGQQFPNFPDLMKKAPADGGFRVLLSHRPAVFPLASENGFQLTLSGHTHGGQFIIPVGNSTKGWSLASMASTFTHGWYEAGKARMYLNRGAGLTFIPWRINCAPEIAVFELIPS